MNTILGEWREVESSPFTGKCSARADLPAWEHLRRSLPRHSIPAASSTTGALGRRFQGMAESGPMGFQNQIQTNTWDGTIPPPAGRPRAQVKERAGRITLFLVVRR